MGSALVNHANHVDIQSIKTNLEGRYKELDLNAEIPEFEAYVSQFIENTAFEYTDSIHYPEKGSFGENLLYPGKTEYEADEYSVTAVLPEGTNLKIKIQGNNWVYPISQYWTMWSRSDWNDSENSRTFTSLKTGTIEFKVNTLPGTLNIYYYENNDAQPMRVKTCNFEGGDEFPPDSTMNPVDSAMVEDSL